MSTSGRPFYLDRENKLIEAGIDLALLEDFQDVGDITSAAVVSESMRQEHICRVKEDGVIAGLEIAARVFQKVDPDLVFTCLVEDGTEVSAGTDVAYIRGSSRSVLAAERTALNFLQRMSGIATLTREFVRKLSGTRAVLLDTRKTGPCLRVFDKMAVRLGGGYNHRFGLYDMIMIKDNHIAAAGGIRQAVERAQRARPRGVEIEVEVANMYQLKEALDAGVDRILLDNMSLVELREAVAATRKRTPLEASGNVNLNTISEIARTGVDFISVGCLTHSVKALDIHLETLSEGVIYGKQTGSSS
ncbi:carboxylating nicotinate-nucleotide diphosphorylase [Spirochaeta dissipatitropha]